MKQVYNIVIAPNDKFSRYSVVLFESLFETNPDKIFQFFVLHSKLSSDRMNMMKDFVEKHGGTITFVCVDEEKYRQLPSMQERISIETYFRLEIQDLLPEDIERVLYLDGDIIVNGDISELYHTDFEGKYIAACGFSDKCEQGDEFNAGMILFNLNKMRGEISFELYKRLAESLEDGYYMDQGILNAQFGRDGTKYVLKEKYNFTFAFYRKFKDRLMKKNPVFKESDVVIMHYTGPGIRPWQAEFTREELDILKKKNLLQIAETQGYIMDDIYFEFTGKWWDYARKTPVYSELKDEMLQQKTKILFEILDGVVNANDYKIGYCIMDTIRKIKKKRK